MPRTIYVPTSTPGQFLEVGTLTPSDILQMADHLHAARRASTIKNAKDAGISAESLYSSLQSHDTRPCRFGDILGWFQSAEGQIEALVRGRMNGAAVDRARALSDLVSAGVDPTTALSFVLDICNIPRAGSDSGVAANPTAPAVDIG